MERPSRRKCVKLERRCGALGLLFWFVLMCLGESRLWDHWFLSLALLFVLPLGAAGVVELTYLVRRHLWLRESRRR